MAMLYLGIDPGFSGALASICNGQPSILDTPILRAQAKKDYDLPRMVACLGAARETGADLHAILESIHSMPGQGVVSMFSMGRGLGVWEGLLAALEIPYTMLSPQKWQRVVGVSGDKQEHYRRACQLFPEIASQLDRKRDGRSDALLLAAAGRILGL